MECFERSKFFHRYPTYLLTYLSQYGEKLVLISQAATPIIAALPAIPPSTANPYTGGQSTGAVRASLQRALDNYKTGHINLPPQGSESDLSRSDTVSFGESHASELSSINSESSFSPANVTPLSAAKPLPSSASPQVQSPPIDVANLNLTPASIPAVENIPDPVQTSPAAVTPTIAETGIPVTADDSNPGPSSGSLLDIRNKESAPSASPVVESQKYESAEEEKKRLAAASLQQTSAEAVAPVEVAPAAQGPSQVAATATAAIPQSESGEEEKKRLEREERDKLLRGGDQDPSSKSQDEDLPPYEEPK